MINFVGKDFWPPSSQDINPLDFCLWSELEDKACKKTYKNVEALKWSQATARSDIPQETIRASVDAVPNHFAPVVLARGGHIENWSANLFYANFEI